MILVQEPTNNFVVLASIEENGAERIILDIPWTPAFLPNLAAWYDLLDASTLTLSAGQIAAIADKSGNGRTQSQATAANRFDYLSVGLTGLPAAQCALGDFMQASAFGSASQRTVFSVNSYDTSSFIYQYVWEQGSTASTSGSGFIPRARDVFGDWQTGDLIAFGDGFAAGRAPRFISAGRTASSDADIYSVSLGNVESAIRVNGVDAATRVQLLASFPASAAAFGLSRSTQSLVGQLSEVIYVDGPISLADRQRVEGYLAWKWSGLL